jgi:hypothetical protein
MPEGPSILIVKETITRSLKEENKSCIRQCKDRHGKTGWEKDH